VLSTGSGLAAATRAPFDLQPTQPTVYRQPSMAHIGHTGMLQHHARSSRILATQYSKQRLDSTRRPDSDQPCEGARCGFALPGATHASLICKRRSLHSAASRESSRESSRERSRFYSDRLHSLVLAAATAPRQLARPQDQRAHDYHTYHTHGARVSSAY